MMHALKTRLKRFKTLAIASALPSLKRGLNTAERWPTSNGSRPSPSRYNPFRDYFQSHAVGPGIWKWEHYFDIYQRHLGKFIGQPCHVAEVGVYSGGSLRMWAECFGPSSHIYGIDIQPDCRAYADSQTSLFIGNQGDPAFWSRFCLDVPGLDVFIDDGSHNHRDQITTFERIVPHLRPGGVYLCEDLTGEHNKFVAYLQGLSQQLNSFDLCSESIVAPSPLQQSIESIHFYPFVAVVEKRAEALDSLRAPRHGTEWQPFTP